MTRSSPPIANAYPPEVKAQAVWMVNNGWTPTEVRDRLGCSTASIGNWRNAPGKLPAFTPDAALLLEAQNRAGHSNDNEGKTDDVSDTDEAVTGNGLVPSETNGAGLPAVPEPAALPVPSTVPAQLVSVADLVNAEQRATRAETALEAAEARITELEAERERTIRDHREALRLAGEETKAATERGDAAVAAEQARSAVFAQTIGYLAPRD